MSDNTGAPSPIPYGFARCCKCQRVRPVHRLECDLLEPDAAWCYSGCDGPAQLTECYHSPTGMALMDEHGRCTCVPPIATPPAPAPQVGDRVRLLRPATYIDENFRLARAPASVGELCQVVELAPVGVLARLACGVTVHLAPAAFALVPPAQPAPPWRPDAHDRLRHGAAKSAPLALPTTPTERRLLQALLAVYDQYAQLWHRHMSAGEAAEELLESYGLVQQGSTGLVLTPIGDALLDEDWL